MLGWSFYQEDTTFGGHVKIADNEYDICDNWWKNTDSQAIFCMEEKDY